MLPFKLILWSHSKLSVQNSSTQQDTAISKHSGWRQMFAGTIRCLFLPFFFFFFVKFNATQCDKLSKAKKPNQTASTVRCLFTTLQKTVGDLCHWMDAVNLGIKGQWGRSHAGREGGREGMGEIKLHQITCYGGECISSSAIPNGKARVVKTRSRAWGEWAAITLRE